MLGISYFQSHILAARPVHLLMKSKQKHNDELIRYG